MLIDACLRLQIDVLSLHVGRENVEVFLVVLILFVDVREDSSNGVEHEAEDDRREKHDQAGVNVFNVVGWLLREIVHHNREGPVKTFKVDCDPF